MSGQWLGVEMDTTLGGLSGHIVPNAELDDREQSFSKAPRRCRAGWLIVRTTAGSLPLLEFKSSVWSSFLPLNRGNQTRPMFFITTFSATGPKPLTTGRMQSYMWLQTVATSLSHNWLQTSRDSQQPVKTISINDSRAHVLGYKFSNNLPSIFWCSPLL